MTTSQRMCQARVPHAATPQAGTGTAAASTGVSA
jgi:hypothetical protein